jgi:hypothetical protein
MRCKLTIRIKPAELLEKLLLRLLKGKNPIGFKSYLSPLDRRRVVIVGT